MNTRTGSFPIAFRRGWSEWQKNLSSLAAWGKSAGYAAIDLGGVPVSELETLKQRGLRVGSVDLIDMGKLLTSDPAARADLVQRNVQHVKAWAASGVRAFFFVLLPDDTSMSKKDQYALAVETIRPICEAAADVGAHLVLEGWPGNPPSFPALGCTPEGVRYLLKELPRGMALNFDPSHLVRLGVDPVRFVREFAANVRHVHGKDTELFGESLYDYGIYQSAAFARGHGFGEHVWRYTIPGHGVVPWTTCLSVLKDAGYHGMVSVELEDEHFNGSEAGEKLGLELSLAYLKGV